MSSSSPRQPWQPPSLAELQAMLPAYEFLALIGRGGMGAVFKATQRSLNRPVAIKVLPASLMEDADANFAARFRQESLTMAKLTHPGIVSVFESGEAGGLLYIVMEFVDGTDVARMIAGEGKLAPELATKLLTQVCDALHYAHQNGVVHRDIKPANLLLTRDGSVKIADFGLAKHHDDALLGLTKTNVAIGTPDFLAPEAWTPNTPLDGRADVYALGVTLYQMLTGEVPRGLWKMPSVKAGVDARFDAIIDRAMQPDRAARYQSSAELRRDLEKIQAGPAEIPTGERSSAKAIGPPPPTFTEVRRLARLRPIAWVLIAVSLVLTGVITVLWLNQPGKDVSSVPPPTGADAQTSLPTPDDGTTPTPPEPWLVTSAADAGPGSLRQAIAETTNGATIAFAANLSGQTIRLTTGELLLDKNLTIDGSGLSRGIRLDGNRASRVFFVASNTTVALDSLTITNGNATALDDANIGGGGVYNVGTLTVNRCTLVGNTTKGGGGGIGSRGPLTVNQCTLTGNRAFGGGGIGIYYFSGGSLAVNQSTLSGNKADGTGKVGAGDDVFSYVAPVTSFNSIISGLHLNQAGLTMTGTNLIETYGVWEDRLDSPAPVSEAPLLAPLGDYGGPTPTMPPLPGSPAIDAGSNAEVTSRSKDQRGFPRRVGARVDIGAVEVARPALKSEVTNTNDTGPGSLRQAMKESASGALITFATNLSGQTIRLTTGHLPLDNNLTIDASALPDGIMLDGNKRSRIFNVPDGNFTNVLTSLIITNGTEAQDGAGIYNRGDLTLNRCQFRRNRGHVGAALYVLQGRTVLNDCVFADNKADYGGAIMSWGTVVANRCTFSGNDASYTGGGAIHNGGDGKEYGVLELNQCTLTGNTCTDTRAGRGMGGGLFNQGRAVLNHTTISGNSAIIGGGVHNTETGTLVLSNSIVAGNRAQAEASGDIFGAFTGAHNLTTGDPLLAPLGDHGGLTPTMPPLAGSPAIDAGSVMNFTYDQRGFSRSVGSAPDLGAVELQTRTPVVTSTEDSGPGSLRQILRQSPDGAVVTFATNLSGRIILLTGGQMELDQDVTIDASALKDGIQLDGNGRGRVFKVASNASVVLDSLLITNGLAAEGSGGGIASAGDLWLKNCTVAGNQAKSTGGGLSASGGNVGIVNSTLTRNTAGKNGGAVAVHGAKGSLTLIHCTIAENQLQGESAGTGGGGVYAYHAMIYCTNSIIAGNTSGGRFGPDLWCRAFLIAAAGCLFGNGADTAVKHGENGNLTGVDARLAPLGRYGGPTPTMPVRPGSPAIDAAIGSTFTNDQRGFPRPIGAGADIGAVEYRPDK